MRPPLTIGIVGGMSPESTVTYYQRIVRRHNAVCGDHSYPRIVIASVSFQEYIDWQHRGEWERVARGLEREFGSVAAAGADFAVLATNTMHKVLPLLVSPIPVLHIVDAVAAHARARGVNAVGLTGTRFTMSDGFYAAALEERGLRVVLPAAEQQEAIHEAIYRELIRGVVRSESVELFESIGRDLVARGADAVLLACTELEMLAHGMPSVIDSTEVHADAALEIALGKLPLPAR